MFNEFDEPVTKLSDLKWVAVFVLVVAAGFGLLYLWGGKP